MLLRMVLWAAMQTTHTITSMEPAAESRPGGRDQYRDSVTRLMQISVDLDKRDILTIYYKAAKAACLVCLSLLSLTGSFWVNFY